MATIRKEIRSPRSAPEVWALLRDFAAVHNLAKGFVTATELEPSGARMVTFANGMQVREWLVSADEGERRLVYAITDSPNFTHYSAAAQVVEVPNGLTHRLTVLLVCQPLPLPMMLVVSARRTKSSTPSNCRAKPAPPPGVGVDVCVSVGVAVWVSVGVAV